MPPAGEPPRAIPAGLILAFIILFIVIIAAGVLFYQAQEKQIKDAEIRDLTTIAVLKADQIAEWRQNRLYDAQGFTSSPFFISGVDHHLSYGDNESRNKILDRFRDMNVSPLYDNILLLDSTGTLRLSLDPSITSVPTYVLKQANASLEGGDPLLTDFHRMPGSKHNYLYAIAPLRMETDGSEKPVGAVLLSIDADDFLYPLVRSWPLPSETAETLLVEREGDHVLFLNELRHQNNTALNLTIPLTQADLPAVMAVTGTTGAFEGKDYRGVQVISALEPVTGSPWFMVAKIDTEEAFSSWRSSALLIMALIMGSLAGAVVILSLVWQRRQKYYYRTLYTAEAEKGREEQRNRERMETLLRLAEMESAGEQELVDFVLDASCRLTDSPLAFLGTVTPDETVLDFTSWSKSGMRDSSLSTPSTRFPIDKTGIWAEAVRQRKTVIVNDPPVDQPAEEGFSPGQIPVSRFVSVPVFEAQRIVIVCTVANRETDYTPLDGDNLTLLMQGVWNHFRKRSADDALRRKTLDLEAAYKEITASREELQAKYEELAKSQRALAESEDRMRQFYDSGLFGVIFWNMDGKITDANDAFLKMTGFTREELSAGAVDWAGMTPPEFRQLDEKSVEELKATGKNLIPFEKEYFRKDGSRIPIIIASAMLDERRFDGVAFVLDISELKTAQAALEESGRKYRNLYQYAQAGLFEMSLKDATVVACNQRYAELFGAGSVEAAIGKEVRSAYLHPEELDEIERILRETGQITDHVARFRNRKTGREFWGQLSARYDYERDVAEGSIIDITVQKEAMETIRMSEERYRSILDTMQDAYFRADSSGTITMANPSAAVMYGYPSPESMIGLPVVSLYRSREDRDEMLQQLDEKGRIADYSGRGRRKDGSLFWVSLNVRVTFDSAGKVVASEGFVRDITDRKLAEQALAKSEEKYRLIVDTAAEGIWLMDDQFRIVYANQQMAAMLGYPVEEMIGKEIRFFMPEGVMADHILRIEHQREGVSDHYEREFLRKDGTSLWTAASVTPVRGDDGTFKGSFAMYADITDRKRAEEALRESEVRFRTMAEWTYDWEYWIDAKRTVIYVSPSVERITGYPPQDFRADPYLIDRIVHPDDRNIWDAHLPLHTQKGSGTDPSRMEFRIVTRDGETRWIGHVCRSIFSDNGIFIGRRISNRDITDRKRAELQREALIRELEQKNAELERFTFTASHDLKSPLITIKGFAGLLEEDARKGDSVQLKKDVLRINEAAETMQALLADLLELSRIGRVAKPPKKTPFHTIAREAVDLLAVPLAERGVMVDIAPDLPDICVDHARIREVMTNLIENAIKFSGDRPDPVIRIGVDRGAKTPVFFVQDNGIGIDPRYLERIFNLFERLDVSVHGTGIGLTIARRIIEVHGGKIWAESEGKGKGTTFRFTLPGTPCNRGGLQ